MYFLQHYLLIGPHVLLGLVLVGIIRRNWVKQLPFFSIYVAFELAQFLTLLIVDKLTTLSLTSYRWLLVCGLGISYILQFGVLYELANGLLLSRSVLAPALRSLFRYAAAVLLLAAATASAILSRLDLGQAANVFQVLDLSAAVIQCGLLIVLFVFTRAFHISWRGPAAGVALGFGIAASLELATAALRGYFGVSGFIATDIAGMVAYHVCVVVWLIYVFLPESVPAFAGSGLQKSEIEFWDQKLQRMVRR